MQQGQRALVRPVHVVDEDQQAALRRQAAQEARGIVEQTHPLLAGRQRRIRRERAQLGFDLRGELRDFGRRGAERRAQLFHALPARPLAERFDEGEIRRRGLILVAASAQQRRAVFLRMRHEILREAGLAHARLTRQQHQLPACLLGVGPVLAQLRRLAVAADQLSAHQLRKGRGIRRSDVLHQQRRKCRRKIGGDELVDGLRFGNSAQLVCAQVAQRRSRRQHLPDAVRRSRREQRLTAVARGHHALHARQCQRRVILAAARLHGAGVQPHPHAHRADVAPALLVQCALRVERGRKRVAGFLERSAEAVTLNLEHVAAMFADRVLQQRVVADQCASSSPRDGVRTGASTLRCP